MGEAGSVHVAILAVAPWSEYAGALQPNFSLNADQAVAEVARDSRWQLQESTTETQGGVDSTLLVTPSDPTGLQSTQQGGQGGFGGGGYQQAPPPSGGPLDGPPLGPDSMLKYTAATALYQEVQLLNRHIGDAAIPAGFRPYMVRLQVSLMPSRRHAPYDAYTTLSFFIPGERSSLGQVDDLARLPVRSTSDQVFERPFGNGPKVLPLVVTDNLESSIQSRSIDQIRGLTASLLDFERFNISETGTTFLGDVVRPMYTAMLSKVMREEVFGRDLNSLLTIARLSENTLRIRLGAMQEATANYAMVPRNHNITVLLMVPEDAPSLVEVVAKTVLVDTQDGLPLDGPDERDEVRRLERFRDEWGLEPVDLGTLRTLHALAQQNDQERFAGLFRSAVPSDHPVLALERSIWIELVGMQIGGQYTSNLFELPGQGLNREESSEVFTSQTVVVEDNLSFAYVTLREARLPESERILAVLRSPAARSDPDEPSDEAFQDEEQPVEGEEPLVLPAESVKADVSRREIRMRFPSLLRWALASDGDPLELAVSWADQRRVFPVHLRQVSDDTPTGVPTQRRALEPAYDFERPENLP